VPNNPLANVDATREAPFDGCNFSGDEIQNANQPCQVPNYYMADYGGPPPDFTPGCWSAWCSGGPTGTVWNEPNPDELEVAYAAYDAEMSDLFWDNYLDSQENAANNSANPPACQAKVLNATNNRFGTNYTNANVTKTFSYSTGVPPDTGTFNVNISGSTAGVSPGYYPVNWYTYIIGYGPTLHVVSGSGGHGGLDSQQTLPFSLTQGTFHIDSGFPYNPFGALSHWLLNMTKVGGYPGC
jgi:hypothetical protein